LENSGPIIQKAELPLAHKLIQWSIVVADVILLGFLVFIFDDIGLLQEAWGWPLIVAAAALCVGQVFVVRRILASNARAKQKDTDGA